MTNSDIRRYTIQSHGVKLARTHLYDWVILLILLAVQIVLNKIDPFNRFVGKDMMDDLKYPFHANTIPFWSVHVFSVALPVIIFVIRYLWRKDVHDLHYAILGLLYAYLITGIITDSIKVGVGRPRPNFFWRCFPDGQDFYDDLNNVICYGDAHVVREGHKSFPSGHTSLSFAGLGYLSLYMTAKLQTFDRKGHICKLCVVFFPFLAAALVGVSRVDDYWHHWTDVFAGALIGITVSFFCYHQFFPPPYRTKGWAPHSYFSALDKEPEINGTSEIQATEQIISPHFSPAQSRADHSIIVE